MSDAGTARLEVSDKAVDLPVTPASEGASGADITKLLSSTGFAHLKARAKGPMQSTSSGPAMIAYSYLSASPVLDDTEPIAELL